jgi:DNA-binding PadR family transcriptional regulator
MPTRGNAKAIQTDENEPSPEFAIIGLLSGAPMHGYELHRKLSDELGGLWHASLQHLYSVLKRLERRGLIAGKTNSATIPAQRVFSVTPDGRRAFETWLAKPCRASAKSVRLEFLPRLYFLSQRDRKAARALLAEQRACIDQQLAATPSTAGSRFARLGGALQRAQLETIQHWLDACEIELRTARVRS